MKIGLDIQDLARKTTGIGRYILGLLDGYCSINKRDEVTLLTKDNINEQNFHIVTHYGYSIIQKKSRSETVWGQYHLTTLLKKHNVDILHCPSVRAPIIHSRPVVLTVHDVIFKLFPEYYTKCDRNYMNILYRLVLNSIDLIISVSECTKNDLIRYFNIPEKKIIVVYNGIDKRFFDAKRSDGREVLKKIKLPMSYILSVGTLEPRKNILNLIKAYELIKKRGCEQELVIVGKRGWLYGEVINYINNSNFNSTIHYVEHVTDDVLILIYQLADLFVYPSIYEGFGYPVVEAMALGIPVIINKTPALEEISNDAAVVVDAKSPYELSCAIEKLLTDKSLREYYNKRGIARASMFSMIENAKKTYNIYKSVV